MAYDANKRTQLLRQLDAISRSVEQNTQESLTAAASQLKTLRKQVEQLEDEYKTELARDRSVLVTLASGAGISSKRIARCLGCTERRVRQIQQETNQR